MFGPTLLKKQKKTVALYSKASHPYVIQFLEEAYSKELLCKVRETFYAKLVSVVNAHMVFDCWELNDSSLYTTQVLHCITVYMQLCLSKPASIIYKNKYILIVEFE